MNEFKGTKGEWNVRFMNGKDDGDCDFFVHAPNKKLSYGTEIMMDDFGEHNGYPRSEKLSDAHLIAAAPDLLEALMLSQNFLKTIQPMLSESKDWSSTIKAGIESNQNAINKA